ncbi:hypothetical protein FQZ97_761210 [compost metagenome]
MQRWQGGQQGAPGGLLMLGVHVGVQKADGHAGDTGGLERVDVRQQARFIERQHGAPVHVHALLNRQPQAARHQRSASLHLKIVLIEAAFGTDLQHVPEAFGGDQGGHCAAPFQHGIGRQRGAVHEYIDVLQTQPVAREQTIGAVEHGPFRGGGGGEHLGCGKRAVGQLDHEVGEGAADVGRQAHPGVGHGAQSRAPEVRKCTNNGKTYAKIDV